jgi:UDP-N-acetyl-D-glucosamine dehydrogenase
VVDLIGQALSMHGLPLRDAQILVLGVAFKPNIDDARNSPAARIIELLLNRQARVRYHDPYIPRFRVGNDVFHHPNVTLESVPLTEAELTNADCVVIITAHRDLDYAQVLQRAQLVVDTCNAITADVREPDAPENLVRLGAPLRRNPHARL